MKLLSFPDRIGKFMTLWIKKLCRGQEEYGETSYDLPDAELLDEIQQECVDLAGWGYILWLKCERLKDKL